MDKRGKIALSQIIILIIGIIAISYALGSEIELIKGEDASQWAYYIDSSDYDSSTLPTNGLGPAKVKSVTHPPPGDTETEYSSKLSNTLSHKFCP